MTNSSRFSTRARSPGGSDNKNDNNSRSDPSNNLAPITRLLSAPRGSLHTHICNRRKTPSQTETAAPTKPL